MAQQSQWVKASLSRFNDHTQTHHTRQDSSGQVIIPTHWSPRDNTKHSQQTDIQAPAGFQPAIPVSEQPRTHVLDYAVTGIGQNMNYVGLLT
jgi:hypothetical protein